MTSPSSEAAHGAAPIPPALGNGKASAAPPKVTGQAIVELDKMAPPEDKLPLHEDIMQLARLGEIGPIQTLFETGKFNARYKDHEGITPLHVSQDITPGTTRYELYLQTGSGLQSTTIMRFANTLSSPARRLMQKAASPLLPLLCGLHSDAISTLSICFLRTAQTLFSQMGRATICFIWQLSTATCFYFLYFSTRTSQLMDQIPRDIHA